MMQWLLPNIINTYIKVCTLHFNRDVDVSGFSEDEEEKRGLVIGSDSYPDTNKHAHTLPEEADPSSSSCILILVTDNASRAQRSRSERTLIIDLKPSHYSVAQRNLFSTQPTKMSLRQTTVWSIYVQVCELVGKVTI